MPVRHNAGTKHGLDTKNRNPGPADALKLDAIRISRTNPISLGLRPDSNHTFQTLYTNTETSP